MIHFNELRITPDNKTLIIDVAVDEELYYKNVILDSIVVDTQDTYIENGPSSTPIYTYTVEKQYDLTYSEVGCNPIEVQEDNSLCLTESILDLKHVRLSIPMTTLGVPCNSMFFVYVISSGNPLKDTPVELIEDKIMRTVVNLSAIYNESMKYITELNKTCCVPKKFIDMILRVRALELCIKTGNFIQAIKYWNKFFKNLTCSTNPTNKNCGCYG